MESGDIIDIPYEPYHSRIDFMRALETIDDPQTYFQSRAQETREYLTMRGAQRAEQLLTEERNTLRIIVDGYNQQSPFLYRYIQISSSLHGVTNTDAIWSEQGTAIPDSGDYIGIFLGFELGTIHTPHTESSYGLIVKTAIEIDVGEWLYFYTPLDVGEAHPILAELN